GGTRRRSPPPDTSLASNSASAVPSHARSGFSERLRKPITATALRAGATIEPLVTDLAVAGAGRWTAHHHAAPPAPSSRAATAPTARQGRSLLAGGAGSRSAAVTRAAAAYRFSGSRSRQCRIARSQRGSRPGP